VMRPRSAAIVFIAGAVLTFAVSGHPPALDVRTAGVILMITGVIGLWPYGGKAWLLLARARLHQFVNEVAPVQGTRVPLDELMDDRRRAAAGGGNVWAPPAGHEQLVQVPADLPEVTRDDEDRESAQAYQGQ
jgi:hypothetical protein